ncbi:MAG: hypothetical protein K0R69_1634 [Clostridia bacterium]|nr:hypothetical protein [Clostridia bacterium]
MKYTKRLIERHMNLSLKLELFIKYKGNKNGGRSISKNLSAVFFVCKSLKE